MACQDCIKDARKKSIIGAVGGALFGAGLSFVILRYVRK